MNTALAQELRREYRRLEKELAPRVREAVAALPLMDADDAIKIVVSQNLIRDCLSIAIEKSLPVSRNYFLEMACRIAACFITALPFDEHEAAAMRVRSGLLPKLADMQAMGFVIKTDWE